MADKRSIQRPEDAKEQKTGLFENVSVSTIAASGLAAITSFLLQSKIGLTGSIIGVGVAAAASAAASQIYKTILSRSANKIKDNLYADDYGQGMTQQARPLYPEAEADRTMLRSRPVPSWQPEDDLDGQAFPDQASHVDVANPADMTQPRIAPDSIRGAVARRKAQTIKRRAIIFSIVIAVVAVLVYAGFVTLATAGKGIGSTTPITQTISKSTSSSQTDAQSTSGQDQTQKTDQTQTEDSKKTTNKKDSEKDKDSSGSKAESTDSGESGSSSSESGSNTGSGSTSSGSSSSNSGSSTDSGTGSSGSGSGAGTTGSGSSSSNSSSSNGSSSSTGSSSNSNSTNSSSTGSSSSSASK